ATFPTTSSRSWCRCATPRRLGGNPLPRRGRGESESGEGPLSLSPGFGPCDRLRLEELDIPCHADASRSGHERSSDGIHGPARLSTVRTESPAAWRGMPGQTPAQCWTRELQRAWSVPSWVSRFRFLPPVLVPERHEHLPRRLRDVGLLPCGAGDEAHLGD